MKKMLCVFAVLFLFFAMLPSSSYAANTSSSGDISCRSIVAGLTSLIIWPGIGQAINENKGKKITTHAIVGIIPIFRFWSGWDALIDRYGGRWDGKI